MSNELIRRLVILGALSIIGIATTQTYWILKAYNLEDDDFHQTVTISLRKVAESIANFNNSELPKHNLIQRRSSNYYAVNVNDRIDAAILEDYLIREFEYQSINTDFEYAIYDCFNQDLVYGNYCQLSDATKEFKRSEDLPEFTDLIYYFVVKFPSRQSYLLSNIGQNIFLSCLTLLALSFFIYSTWVILRQKRLSELQKDFINNMTHEFKTPISSIKIAADVLFNHDVIKKNERLNRYAQIVVDQNQRLNSQVEKVLNLAKLEEDEFKLDKKKVDLERSLRQIVESEYIKHGKEHNIKFNQKYPKEQILINADPLHFTNIITNILDNAVKYSDVQKMINIEVKNGDKFISIIISDNGIGIGISPGDIYLPGPPGPGPGALLKVVNSNLNAGNTPINGNFTRDNLNYTTTNRNFNGDNRNGRITTSNSRSGDNNTKSSGSRSSTSGAPTSGGGGTTPLGQTLSQTFSHPRSTRKLSREEARKRSQAAHELT